MEESSGSGRRPPQPPRKELQGPRPAPLKVRKDSVKIKKPPPAPVPAPATSHRAPVIIYAVSPKIIHTSPSGFMDLVQRLTGAETSTTTTATSNARPLPSPAARFASIEMTKPPPEPRRSVIYLDDTPTGLDRPGPGNSILSPGPSGLTRPVPAAFFSDPFSPLMNLYHHHQNDHLNALHQIQHGAGAGNLTPASPMLSPASIDFLKRLLDQDLY